MTTPTARDPGRVFTWTPPITPASEYKNLGTNHGHVASHQAPPSHSIYRGRDHTPAPRRTEPEEPIWISPDPESAVSDDDLGVPTDLCLDVSEQPSEGALSATRPVASRAHPYVIGHPQRMIDINSTDTTEDTVDQLGGRCVHSPDVGRGIRQAMTDAEPTCCPLGSSKSLPSLVPLNPTVVSTTYPDFGQDKPHEDTGGTDGVAMATSPSILVRERDAATSETPTWIPLSTGSQPRGSCDSSVVSHSDSESCYDSRSDLCSESDSISDSDGSGRQGDHDYYPGPGSDDPQSGSQTADSYATSVQGRRKRPNAGNSYTKSKTQPRRGRNSCHIPGSPQAARSAQASGSHILGSRRSSSVNNRASAIPGTKFEEWPLTDVVLKRITEQGRATFQLQFEWDPFLVEHRPGRAKCNSQSAPRRQKVRLHRGVPAKRAAFTREEDDLLRELKEQDLPWAQVHSRFNEAFVGGWRSQGSLQVHYSTKLKNRGAR